MEVDCAGCAGCCLDWRSIRPTAAGSNAEGSSATGSTVPYEPLDDVANFVALTRTELRRYVDDGLAAAVTPRFWVAPDDPARHVEVDGRRIAAIDGKPVFFVGLRKPPKPVAPFGVEDAHWLPACVFLDPATLQCRIYEDEHFPAECGTYPSTTLSLGHETECERVEAAFGGRRLLEADPDDVDGPRFGPGVIGSKLFCHPRPAELAGLIDRLARASLTREDRFRCLAVATASSPGTTTISESHYEATLGHLREKVESTAWVEDGIDEWHEQARTRPPRPSLASQVEGARGAPETQGWPTTDGDSSA